MTLVDFVNYWDNWHNEWHTQALKWNGKGGPDYNVDKILNWPVLKAFADKKRTIQAWQAFPEPYWGNPLSQNLMAVFINLNPGNASNNQTINASQDFYEPYHLYVSKKGSYYNTIQKILGIDEYITNRAFATRRARKATRILGQPVTRDTLLMFELIPWHTPSILGLRYFNGHTCVLIEDYILNFAAEAAKSIANSVLKNIVLIRGSWVLQLDEYKSLQLRDFHLHNFPNSWTVKYFVRNGVAYINFSSPGGNYFPANNKEIIRIVNEVKNKEGIT